MSEPYDFVQDFYILRGTGWQGSFRPSGCGQWCLLRAGGTRQEWSGSHKLMRFCNCCSFKPLLETLLLGLVWSPFKRFWVPFTDLALDPLIPSFMKKKPKKRARPYLVGQIDFGVLFAAWFVVKWWLLKFIGEAVKLQIISQFNTIVWNIIKRGQGWTWKPDRSFEGQNSGLC